MEAGFLKLIDSDWLNWMESGLMKWMESVWMESDSLLETYLEIVALSCRLCVP